MFFYLKREELDREPQEIYDQRYKHSKSFTLIYLNKLAAALLNPLTIALILLTFSLFTKKLWLRISALILLFLSSNPLISNFLIGSLEKQYERVVIGDLPEMDVLIVLSGMVDVKQFGSGDIQYEFNAAVDRILKGIELAKLDKVNQLVLTNGIHPWSKGQPEGEFLRLLAIKSGVPENRITLTKNVQNTEQELLALQGLVDDNDVVGLVTSAFHMERAMKYLRNTKIQVVAIPVDYRSTSARLSVIDFLPSVDALKKTQLYLKEQLGLLQITVLR